MVLEDRLPSVLRKAERLSDALAEAARGEKWGGLDRNIERLPELTDSVSGFLSGPKPRYLNIVKSAKILLDTLKAIQNHVHFAIELSDHDVEKASISSFFKRQETVGNLMDSVVAELELILPRSEDEEISHLSEEIRRQIPQQRLAPARFDITDGLLHVARARSDVDEGDQAATKAAMAALIESGERIVSELRGSNCDKRLVATFVELEKQLRSGENIIQLGYTSLACDRLRAKFENEIPDAVVAAMEAHSEGVQLYLAQFPDWIRFMQNAASAHLTEEDVAIIGETAERAVEKLIEAGSAVDSEVPKTIEFLRNLIASPGRESKRAAYAMIVTIENLVSKIAHYSADFMDKTVNKTIDEMSSKLAKGISRAAVVALLAVALEGAIGLSQIADASSVSAWKQGVADLIRKQIESFDNKK